MNRIDLVRSSAVYWGSEIWNMATNTVTPQQEHGRDGRSELTIPSQRSEDPMGAEEETLVRVHREWRDWQSAEVRLTDLHDIHWLQPRGAPRSLVHAHVWCTNFISGNIPHDCGSSLRPHRLLVCVLKSHVVRRVYSTISRRAVATRQELSTWPTPPFRGGGASKDCE
jgi:hypothetical protein